ncbi:MAG: ATP-binding protein [Deltaproteobacteria bacterium]|nr:ATP-binding protein [Deltaproteobacteria bacterium]
MSSGAEHGNTEVRPSTLHAWCGQLLQTGLQCAPDAFAPLAAQTLRRAQEAGDDNLVETVTAALAMTTTRAMTRTSMTPLWTARMPRRRLVDLVLPEAVQRSCQEFLDDHRHAIALQAQGLTPRNRILLDGPPGNGKTSLAEALAAALALPFYVVRYDRLIGGTLSDTLANLGQLFDHAQQQPCVVFFDEFDTVGKERGDATDTTDVKRAVGMLLIQIELTPPPTIVMAATNHQELLDHAAWRRFHLRVHLPRPTLPQVVQWFTRLREDLPFPLPLVQELSDRMVEVSFAELEDFSLDLRRRVVIEGPTADLGTVVKQRLSLWSRRLIPAGYGGR